MFSLAYYFPFAGGIILGSVLWEMQTARSRNWTHVIACISHDDRHYATGCMYTINKLWIILRVERHWNLSGNRLSVNRILNLFRWVSLVGFYGTPTILSYLMPKHLYTNILNIFEVPTISFQTFFVWALLLIVPTWNSSSLRSNLLPLQSTCSNVPTISRRPHGSPLVWACQWRSSQPLSSLQFSHNDSLWS